METPDKSTEYKELFHFGPFCLDAAERSLTQGGEAVPLPGKTFDLLLLLVKSAGHLKTRDELAEALWPTTIVVENSLSWHVGALRKALGPTEDGGRYIETVHRHGYRFTVPVEVERVALPAPAEYSGQPSNAVSGESRAWHAPAEEEAGIATEVAPTERAPARRRRILLALSAVAIVAIAGVLIWRFVPFGAIGGGKAATPVIAVLPFENLSADKDNAYFAAGIQDTILSKLAGIGELRVISRTSTERYTSHPRNLKQVATELGATVIMEGSVQKSGKQVMINVQLIDAATNEHLWAHVYTRSLADVFAVENDVATQVAAALKTELLPTEATRLAQAPTRDPQAYLLFLKAEYYTNQVTRSTSAKNPSATIVQAVNLYHQAINRDPHYALAWARLAFLKGYAYWRGITRSPQIADEAEQAARQALALAPSSPQARLAMGYVEFYVHRNYTAALVQFEYAYQGLPNDAQVIEIMAACHRRQGKWQKVLTELRQATTLNPRSPHLAYEVGYTYMLLREYAKAEQAFDRALALAPQDYDAVTLKAMTLLLAGHPPHKVRQLLAGFDHGDESGLLMALRFEAAWLGHQPIKALAVVSEAPDWVSAPNAIGRVPVSLLRAEVLALQRNQTQARQAYANARTLLQKTLREQPYRVSLWSFLGLAEAGLGQKQKAIQAGRKATSLTPVSKDAVYGPSYLVSLAKIYVQVGKPDQALKLLRRLLSMPAGLFISVPILERDPIWNPLRQNPEFQALLNKYRKTPAPANKSASG